MKLTRIQLYILGLIVLFTPFVAYRLIWLARSNQTIGRVLYINTTRRYDNTYPVIQFETENSIVNFRGHYNALYNEGDPVPIRYIPNNPTSCRINSFWNLWIEVFIVNGIFLIFWSFLFVKSIIPNSEFLITRKGIKSV